MTQAAMTLEAFRLRRDDGSETSATWYAPLNTNADIPSGQTFRARFAVRVDNKNAVNVDYNLRYSRNGGAWTAVTTSSAIVRAVASPNVTHDGSTTQQISSGNYAAGRISETGGIINQTINAGVRAELEYVIQILAAGVTDGDTIQLRPYKWNDLLDSYAFAPTVTVGAGAPPALSITTETLPSAHEGVAYSQQLQAEGGTEPYTWAVISGSLPAGLTLASDGTISGTPTDGGSYNFTVQVTDDDSATDTQALSIDVATPPQGDKIWSEDFDYPNGPLPLSTNTTPLTWMPAALWQLETWPDRGYNDWAGYSYNRNPHGTDSNPFHVEDGILRVEVIRETTNAGAGVPGGHDANTTREWQGGMLITDPRPPHVSDTGPGGRVFTEGYIEWRARWPIPGQGMFPALWSFATGNVSEAKRGAEIDMVEIFGHITGSPWTLSAHHDSERVGPGPLYDALSPNINDDTTIWHRYGLERIDDELRFYRDGVHLFTWDDDDWWNGVPMDIRINFSMFDGPVSWGAGGQATAQTPDLMYVEVDYVRAYDALPTIALIETSDDPEQQPSPTYRMFASDFSGGGTSPPQSWFDDVKAAGVEGFATTTHTYWDGNPVQNLNSHVSLERALNAGLWIAAYGRPVTMWYEALEHLPTAIRNELRFFALDVEPEPGNTYEVEHAHVTGVWETFGVRPIIYTGWGMWGDVMGWSPYNSDFDYVPLWDWGGQDWPSSDWPVNMTQFPIFEYGGWNLGAPHWSTWQNPGYNMGDTVENVTNRRIGAQIQMFSEYTFNGYAVTRELFDADFIDVEPPPSEAIAPPLSLYIG